MTIYPSSLAAIVGVGVENQQFAVSAQVVPQKNVIIGTFDEATFLTIVPNVPLRVFSPADVGGRTGYGFMLHRLAKAMFKPGSVETWIIPQLEGGSDPDQATGTIDFTTSLNPVAGTIHLYIAGEHVPVNITAGMSDTAIGDAVEAAVNANDDLSVTANNVAGIVTFTSKSGGTWGNHISLEFNLGGGEVLPTGVAAVVVDMSGGAGVPDIQDALDALGTGDGQNEDFFTNVIHGYGTDTGTLNALSEYNGVGNEFIGNYKKEIARPFRSLFCDVTPGSAGLAAALIAADLRRDDRTNGFIAAPGSPNHPSEIAAQAVGVIAVTNSIRAEEGYIDKALDGVYPGAIADRWTNDYDSRDQAVRGGVGTTLYKGGVLTLQNVITLYRPTTVAPESNGYRAMRNISILQNLLYNYRMNFERTKWKGISIVEDTAKVSNINDRLKARDVDAILDDLVDLANVFAGNAWLYTASYTISELQKGDKVTLRAGLTGFDIIFPVILSGEGGIYNSTITFDTSIAILTAGGA
jgi:phage tail sheath gpL-like